MPKYLDYLLLCGQQNGTRLHIALASVTWMFESKVKYLPESPCHLMVTFEMAAEPQIHVARWTYMEIWH